MKLRLIDPRSRFDRDERKADNKVKELVQQNQRWFAWYPVSVGTYDTRWLEWVYRWYPAAQIWGITSVKKGCPQYSALTKKR